MEQVPMQVNSTPIGNKKAFLWGGYVVLGLFCVFYLPYLFRVPFTASDSYLFGYNNRVGQALVVVFTALGAILLRNVKLLSSRSHDRESIRSSAVITCLAITSIVCIGLYMLTSRVGAYGESAYQINRIELASQGLHPYRDFEFAYGAALLYLPLWISRITGSTIPDGYYIFWVLTELFGVLMLRALVEGLDFSGKYRTQIFTWMYVAGATSAFYTGTNYTFFRFALAPLLALYVYRFLAQNTMRGWYSATSLAVLSAAMLMFISPEIAIAFAVGSTVFFLLFLSRVKSLFAVIAYIGMIGMFGLILYVSHALSVFVTMQAFSGGGYGFPILPAPAILLFLFSLAICAQLSAYAISTSHYLTNTIYALAISFPLLASALGRCDPGHIYWNGIVVFIVAMLWSSGKPTAWRWYRGAFVVIFCVFSIISNLDLYKNGLGFSAVVWVLSHPAAPAWMRKKVDTYIHVKIPEKVTRLYTQSTWDASKDPAALSPQLGVTVEAPFGYTIGHSPSLLDSGYYLGLTNVLDAHGVDQKIQEIEKQRSRMLLLPPHHDSFCKIDPVASRQLIQHLFIYPFPPRSGHAESVYQPLCDYIGANYKASDSLHEVAYGYEVWLRKQ